MNDTYIKTHHRDGQPKTMAEMLSELDSKETKRLGTICRFPVPYYTSDWTAQDWEQHITKFCPCVKHTAARKVAGKIVEGR